MFNNVATEIVLLNKITDNLINNKNQLRQNIYGILMTNLIKYSS